MLNDRQRNMIRDLEDSLVLISARQLAVKYDVSLRTVRNDVNAIADYLKENGVEFLRIPGSGMKIVSSHKVSERFSRQMKCRDFPYLDHKKRIALLIMKFVFLDAPISGNDLCDSFEVSKGTIVNTIRSANEELINRNISINRYRNRGYRMQGREKAILRLNESLLNDLGDEFLYNTLTDPENGFFDGNTFTVLNETLSFMSNNLFLYISRHHYLVYMLYALIRGSNPNKRRFNEENQNQEGKLQKLCEYIEERFDVRFSRESYQYLKHILNVSTDYSDNGNINDMDIKLPEAVDAMISYVSSSGMYQINDNENLRIDLIIHMKSTIDAINSGMPRENPLLDEIRSSYPNEFNLVKSSVKYFNRIYPLDLDDHEVGYITLYFLRSFEKSEKLQETRVMVVCNTGRSASKLLATRLINNIPDIHIVSMNSYYNISTNPHIFDNVDFVVSTIPLPDIKKPSVVISPLLQKNEIARVKEAIWLSSSSIFTSKSVENAAADIVEQYNTYKDGDHFLKEKRIPDIKNALPNESIMLLGESAMNLFELIGQLYPEGISTENYSNLSGIFAHVLMSLPRWQRSEFIDPLDTGELQKLYPVQYECIKAYLAKQSKTIGVFIPEDEVTAILRYYIY